METSNMNCLSGLGMMDHSSFMRDWSMDFLDELNTLSYDHHHHHHHQHQQQQQQPPMMSHKHEYTELSPNDQAEFGYTMRPVKQQKSSSWSTDSSSNSQDKSPQFHVVNSSTHVQAPLVKPKEEAKASSFTLNFAPPNGVQMAPYDYQYESHVNHVYKASQGAKRIVSPNPTRLTQAQDHIIAERKRREKLSQRFIAMSALLPGLKKMDKASVLGDAIKYIKQLQEKVASLEDTRKKSIETAVFVRKNRVSEDGSNEFSDEPLPQIEAKVCKKDVLIRVHCEKIKGIQEAIVAEIEKLSHLSVMNSCSLTFGDSNLDITILAKMEEQFTMPMEDLVMHLSSALKKFM